MANDDITLEQRMLRMEARLDQLVELLSAQRIPEGRSSAGNGHHAHRAQDAGRDGSAPANEAAPLQRAWQEVQTGLCETYGPSAVQHQLAEALYTLSDPETVDALARIATMAPKLEYALNFVAAGPELLEEGIEAVQQFASAHGEDPQALKARIGTASRLLNDLTSLGNQQVLAKLASLAPAMLPLLDGAAKAAAQLGAAEGGEAVSARIADTLLQLTEAETLDALTRLALLAPKLEYAANMAAAGPELLEEAMEMARELVAQGGDQVTQAVRLATLKRLACDLSSPTAMSAVGQLATMLPALTPLARGVSDAAAQLNAVEGEEAVRKRIAEAVLCLADAETLEALTRLAGLMPKLEYAVQFAAAGPELLEEGIEMVRAQLGDGAEAQVRMQRMRELGRALFVPETLQAIALVMPTLSVLLPVITGATAALKRVVAVEGEKTISDRVDEALSTLMDGETLAALLRIAQLTPRLEYAVQAAAAGPELYEEAAALVRKRLGDDRALLRGLDAGLELAKLATDADTLRPIKRLLAALPQLDDAGLGDMLTRGQQVLPDVNRLLTRVPLERVTELAELTTRPEMMKAVRGLIEITPALVPVLQALPVQDRTLEILKTVNAAVEEAAAGGEEVGAFGLLRALSDPAVKRSAGFAITVARRLGQYLEASPKQLSRG